MFGVRSGGMEVSFTLAAKRIIAAGKTSGMGKDSISKMSVGGFQLGKGPVGICLPEDCGLEIASMETNEEPPPTLLPTLIVSANLP